MLLAAFGLIDWISTLPVGSSRRIRVAVFPIYNGGISGVVGRIHGGHVGPNAFTDSLRLGSCGDLIRLFNDYLSLLVESLNVGGKSVELWLGSGSHRRFAFIHL